MTQSTKYCKDCIHIAYYGGGRSGAKREVLCARPLGVINPVFGTMINLNKDALKERSNLNGCGFDGKFFEATPVRRSFLTRLRDYLFVDTAWY